MSIHDRPMPKDVALIVPSLELWPADSELKAEIRGEQEAVRRYRAREMGPGRTCAPGEHWVSPQGAKP
jgi:hypothetical protein